MKCISKLELQVLVGNKFADKQNQFREKNQKLMKTDQEPIVLHARLQ